MTRDLSDVRICVLMIDGVDLKGRTNVVALGISTEGEKIALGLWEGSTENATVAQALVSDLVARCLDTEQGLLVVMDGGQSAAQCGQDRAGRAHPGAALHPPLCRPARYADSGAEAAANSGIADHVVGIIRRR
jgi:hypothetical protein